MLGIVAFKAACWKEDYGSALHLLDKKNVGTSSRNYENRSQNYEKIFRNYEIRISKLQEKISQEKIS